MTHRLWILLILGLFFLPMGCAPKFWTAPPELEKDPAEVWQELKAREQQKLGDHQGYLARSSLHYQSSRNSSRLVFSLWGNYALPLRLDLKAGIGTSLSHWRLGQDMTLAYYPRQDKVFVYKDAEQALRHLQLELPFTVPEIGQILTGRWADLVPSDYTRARTVQGKGWEFDFPDSSRLQSILVDPEFRIIQARGHSPLNWELELKDFQDTQGTDTYARSLELDMGQEGRALFRIRELELREQAWPDSRLKLEPPQDVQYVPLAL